MISLKTLKTLEYDQIMRFVADRAVLNSSKETIFKTCPCCSLSDANLLLDKTKEAYNLIYNYSVGGVFYFDDVCDILTRADMGGTLNNAELLKVCANLKSARLMKTSIDRINDNSIILIREISSRLYLSLPFEEEIERIIISEDEISDNASQKLYSIRKSIRNLNASIREKLNSYMRGKDSKFLQDGVVTMRQDRFVIPVKSEYRSSIKGFIHDQSSSGATVFIEPEVVMELNNDLKRALLDEQAEIHKILAELSARVASISDSIRYNAENLCEIDQFFARAIYSFDNHCSFPILNDSGLVKINNGRHPLINKQKVVPISLELGKNFNFLLISGPNTGGKTVTMKLVGLLSLMAMSGLYVPADDESQLSVFENIFCDIGDEQSIENNLSTFSSHMKNVIETIDNVNKNSLVLLDELGAGTDPEEGCALALAIINKLIEFDCRGIITTHYSRLKEFAVENDKIENACMEFDSLTLKPMYKINIGMPGSSNAIDIAKTLGINEEIIVNALSYLTNEQISFEKVMRKAEESRRENERLSLQLQRVEIEKQSELDKIALERKKISEQREKIYNTAKQETKRIVADKLEEAEEIIAELKSILNKVGLESKEIFRAGELRNRLKNSRYLTSEDDNAPLELKNVKINELKVGNRVYIKSISSYGIVNKINQKKKEVEVTLGDIKTVVKLSDLFNLENITKQKPDNVKIFRNTKYLPATEINVIGKTSLEAVTELGNFIDQAIINNLEEIKVIHGVGEGILLKEIRQYLKNDKNVLEFRRGNYGEGENGVTIIRLK